MIVGLVACGVLACAACPGALGRRIEAAVLVEAAFALAVFDARHLVIPDLYSALFALAGLVGPLSPGLVPAVLGAAVGGALTAAVRAAAGRALGREAMGWGDVKLAAALGALLGPAPLLWTLAAAAGLGAGVGLALRRREPDAVVPFGALMAPVGVAFLWAGAPA